MRPIAVALVLLSWPVLAVADDSLAQAMQEDVVLRALVDELERGIPGLKIEDLERPYFIEYGLLDTTSAYVSAELGAVIGRSEDRSRMLRTEVRVGSYELDNTNFEQGYGRYYRARGGYGGSSLPIENDYEAIRQAIWWATDREYKDVVESIAKKKAFMESKMIEDKPDDFARATPVVHIEALDQVALDQAELEQIAVELSAIFLDYPDVQDSGVTVVAAAGNKYLVNTEGTRLREAGFRYSISAMALVQADDGMELTDSFSVQVREKSDLPSVDELQRRCREMTEQLVAVKNAPRLDESYTGPVLFEAQAAAELFAGRFADRYCGGQRPVGSRTSPEDFANKLERRILPRFMDVVDDPTVERIAGEPIMGHYDYDDQGVAGQRVSLVEKGRLKALLMSRNPSKEFSNSNGHGRGFFGPQAGVGCLIVTADPASTAEELKEELLEACADEGLPYGIRVVSLSGSGPLVMYKVYTDGHEELVRGADIANAGLKTFKRMLAAGDSPHVLNLTSRTHSQTVVAPAMLFEELDLAKIDRDFDKPPILENPLARH